MVAATPGPAAASPGVGACGAGEKPLGSVADEAARLVDVLAARAAARGGAARPNTSGTASSAASFRRSEARPPGGTPAAAGSPVEAGSQPATSSQAGAGEGTRPPAGVNQSAQTGSWAASAWPQDARGKPTPPLIDEPAGHTADEPFEGCREEPIGERGAQTDAAAPCPECGCGAAHVCAACPICRAATAVRLVSPAVLDAVADLAGMAARALRAAAERQRHASGTRRGPEGSGLGWPGTIPDPPTPPHERY